MEKGIKHRFFRDKWMNVLLMLALGISFFLTLNGLQTMNEIQAVYENQRQQQKHEKYTAVFDLTENNVEEETEPREKDFFGNIPCNYSNIILSGIVISVRGTSQYQSLQICLKENETPKYQLEYGKYNDNPGHVVIEKSLLKWTEEREDGTYICIENEWYKVTGVYARSILEEQLGERPLILISYTAMSKSLKEMVYQWVSGTGSGAGYELCLESNQNKERVEKDVENLQTFIHTWLNENETLEKTELSESEMTAQNNMENYQKMSQNITAALLGFSLLNCVIIIRLWIQRRRKEFVIRKTFGEGNGRILLHVAAELAKLTLSASFIVWILEYGYYKMSGMAFMQGMPMLYNFARLFLIMVFFMILLLIIPIINIIRLQPAEGMREE